MAGILGVDTLQESFEYSFLPTWFNKSYLLLCLMSILHIIGLEHLPICIQKDILCTIKLFCVPILTIIISFIHIYVSHGVFFEQFVVFYVIHNVSFNFFYI